MDEYIQALNWRYATKNFSDKQVSDADIAEIREVFRLTASSFGLEPWKLFIVKNDELQQELQTQSYNQSQVGDCSHLLVFAQKTDIDQKLIDENLDRICEVQGKTREDLQAYEAVLSRFINETPDEQKQIWARDQVFIALGNVMSFLAHKKIDSCAIGGFLPDEYDRMLGLPEKGYTSTVVLTIGYRASDDRNPERKKVRLPLERTSEIIF